MTASLATVSYIGATILFLLSLGGLSNPETARRGNLFGMIGMAIAVLATILGPRVTKDDREWCGLCLRGRCQIDRIDRLTQRVSGLRVGRRAWASAGPRPAGRAGGNERLSAVVLEADPPALHGDETHTVLVDRQRIRTPEVDRGGRGRVDALEDRIGEANAGV